MESGGSAAAATLTTADPAPFRAKLAPQRMPRGAIRRPALVEILGQGSGATLTLICAPAGFGKTTLLTEWVETASTSALPTAFAWVTLDSRDNEPVRFWRHVIAALAGASPGVGERSLEAIRAGPDRILDAALPLLFDDLGRVQTPIVLILDDYYRAERSRSTSPWNKFCPTARTACGSSWRPIGPGSGDSPAEGIGESGRAADRLLGVLG